MKKILLGLVVLSFSALAVDESLQEKTVKYFKSDAEPKVIDAVWTSNTTFKVGVKDDGTNRNGFAEYVCMELRSQGIKDKNLLIRVIDYPKLATTGKWVNLGTASCK